VSGDRYITIKKKFEIPVVGYDIEKKRINMLPPIGGGKEKVNGD
jgi:hypothetical protein